MYEGLYHDDKRQGYGEMFWVDGTTYKGNWMHGAQHGKGTHTLPNGETKIGIFENNNFVKEEPNDDNVGLNSKIPHV